VQTDLTPARPKSAQDLREDVEVKSIGFTKQASEKDIRDIASISFLVIIALADDSSLETISTMLTCQKN
jgi:hypothetical protein